MMKARPITVAIHYKSYGEQWCSMLVERLKEFVIGPVPIPIKSERL